MTTKNTLPFLKETIDQYKNKGDDALKEFEKLFIGKRKIVDILLFPLVKIKLHKAMKFYKKAGKIAKLIKQFEIEEERELTRKEIKIIGEIGEIF